MWKKVKSEFAYQWLLFRQGPRLSFWCYSWIGGRQCYLLLSRAWAGNDQEAGSLLLSKTELHIFTHVLCNANHAPCSLLLSILKIKHRDIFTHVLCNAYHVLKHSAPVQQSVCMILLPDWRKEPSSHCVIWFSTSETFPSPLLLFTCLQAYNVCTMCQAIYKAWNPCKFEILSGSTF